jgi:23S rRNA (adenine2503-C2)-methyltransferase
MIDILSLNLAELERQLPNLPKFRAKQIFEWLHVKKVSDFAEMSNIPADLRRELSERFLLQSLKVLKRLVSKRKDTVKYLYGLHDGQSIETVVMSHKHGNSLCISSQVGCKMGCAFCASGGDTTAGMTDSPNRGTFERNLSAGEMLLQLYQSEKPIDSVVIMGIGEPLDNYDNLLRFLELLQQGHGMSLRHVSLSTCGLADRIDELAGLRSGLTLSISLHACTDSERTAIMPINARFPLSRLLDSCENYFRETGRRLSFEYALIADVNDSESHANRLVKLLSRLPRHSYHVNLIPVNQIGNRFKQSKNAKSFAEMLEKSGVNTTIRRTMGADINAACGQLRKKTKEL